MVVPPTANGIINDSIASLQFYNTKDSLYILIKANIIDSISLFLDTDCDDKKDFVLKQDSLFRYNNGILEFIKKINASGTEKLIEESLAINDISLTEQDAFLANLFINNKELWWTNQDFYYMKHAELNPPKNFGVEASASDPYTRLKIKWTKNSSPDGYIVERSIGDSLNFEKIKELSSSSFYFIDTGLDSSKVYYYRAFAYKEISRSDYTDIKWMKPGGTTSINKLNKNEFEMSLAPNPMTNSTILQINNTKLIYGIIELYNSKGELARRYFEGKLHPKMKIKISKSNLSSGIYTLVLKTKSSISTKKLLIK